MAIDHYENFPVASWLMPARLRPPIHAIYAFARSADDLADEGDATPTQRLQALSEYEHSLHAIAEQRPSSVETAMFGALKSAIDGWNLPLQPFFDLLSAFKQDVSTTRYDNYAELADYCRRSANPVGTLMLHLYETPTLLNIQDSNAICTSLQLINFLQDVGIDWQKERIYLPQDEMKRFAVTEAQIEAGQVDSNWCKMMDFQVRRARSLMLSGAPLAGRLPGRIGWELRMIVQGGLRILQRIEHARYDVFRKRPMLGAADWVAIAWAAVAMQ